MLPVLLQFGSFRIDTYWVMIGAGLFASAAFWRSRRKQMGLRSDQQFWLLLNSIVLGAYAGGRLVQMLVYVPFSAPDYWEQFISWSSGFSILGDILGGTAGVLLFCRIQGVAFARLFDYLCLMIPVWDFFGRFGCLSAGCCYGRPAEGLPWAISFHDPRAQTPPEWIGRPLHPTQLYEAAGEALLFLGLYLLLLPLVEAGKLKRGSLAAAFFGGYGLLRFADEFFRGDAVPWALGLTAAQGFALGFLALSGAGLLALNRRPA